MTQQMAEQVMQLMETDKDVVRARAFLALELGHAKARAAEQSSQKEL